MSDKVSLSQIFTKLVPLSGTSFYDKCVQEAFEREIGIFNLLSNFKTLHASWRQITTRGVRGHSVESLAQTISNNEREHQSCEKIALHTLVGRCMTRDNMKTMQILATDRKYFTQQVIDNATKYAAKNGGARDDISAFEEQKESEQMNLSFLEHEEEPTAAIDTQSVINNSQSIAVNGQALAIQPESKVMVDMNHPNNSQVTRLHIMNTFKRVEARTKVEVLQDLLFQFNNEFGSDRLQHLYQNLPELINKRADHDAFVDSLADPDRIVYDRNQNDYLRPIVQNILMPPPPPPQPIVVPPPPPVVVSHNTSFTSTRSVSIQSQVLSMEVQPQPKPEATIQSQIATMEIQLQPKQVADASLQTLPLPQPVMRNRKIGVKPIVFQSHFEQQMTPRTLSFKCQPNTDQLDSMPEIRFKGTGPRLSDTESELEDLSITVADLKEAIDEEPEFLMDDPFEDQIAEPTIAMASPQYSSDSVNTSDYVSSFEETNFEPDNEEIKLIGMPQSLVRAFGERHDLSVKQHPREFERYLIEVDRLREIKQQQYKDFKTRRYQKKQYNQKKREAKAQAKVESEKEFTQILQASAPLKKQQAAPILKRHMGSDNLFEESPKKRVRISEAPSVKKEYEEEKQFEEPLYQVNDDFEEVGHRTFAIKDDASDGSVKTTDLVKMKDGFTYFKSDLESFGPNECLTTNAIAPYVHMLNKESDGEIVIEVELGQKLAGAPLTPRQVYHMIRKKHPAMTKLFVPVCGAFHWTILGYDFNENIIYYGESMSGRELYYMQKEKFLQNIVIPIVTDFTLFPEPREHGKDELSYRKIDIIEKNIMKSEVKAFSSGDQRDGYNCGIHALYALRCIILEGRVPEDLKSWFNSDKADEFRKLALAELKDEQINLQVQLKPEEPKPEPVKEIDIRLRSKSPIKVEPRSLIGASEKEKQLMENIKPKFFRPYDSRRKFIAFGLALDNVYNRGCVHGTPETLAQKMKFLEADCGSIIADDISAFTKLVNQYRTGTYIEKLYRKKEVIDRGWQVDEKFLGDTFDFLRKKNLV